MSKIEQTHLHPVEKAKALEGPFRKLIQNPKKSVEKYIQSGMTVLDLGCGTGYFTTEIAKLLDDSGKVVAADVQEGMLKILKQKIEGSTLQKKIKIHKCQENHLGLTEKFDFVFAFYSFHEMKYIDNIINELKEIVKPKTKIFISEQKFHVTKYTFNTIVQKMENKGFRICERPKVFFSRTVVMEIKT